MAGRRKVTGLLLGAVGIGILIAFILPQWLVIILEGSILVIVGWMLLRKG